MILLVVLLVMSAFLFYLMIKKDQFAPGKDSSSTEDTNTGKDSGDQKGNTEVSGGEELEKKIQAQISEMSLEEKIYQLFFVTQYRCIL